MISDADFNNDMWLGPGIWVPPGVADYLISRTQWIREGEKGNFQLGVPNGYEFDDLATLAYLMVTDDVVAAKELADNLPRPMWMETSSSSMVEENLNYNFKNPFKRGRGKQRTRKRNGAAENSVHVIVSLPQSSICCTVMCSILPSVCPSTYSIPLVHPYLMCY